MEIKMGKYENGREKLVQVYRNTICRDPKSITLNNTMKLLPLHSMLNKSYTIVY